MRSPGSHLLIIGGILLAAAVAAAAAPGARPNVGARAAVVRVGNGVTTDERREPRNGRGTVVDAPAAHVDTRGGVEVDAPGTHVDVSRGSVHVEAPFVNLRVPR